MSTTAVGTPGVHARLANGVGTFPVRFRITRQQFRPCFDVGAGKVQHCFVGQLHIKRIGDKSRRCFVHHVHPRFDRGVGDDECPDRRCFHGVRVAFPVPPCRDVAGVQSDPSEFGNVTATDQPQSGVRANHGLLSGGLDKGGVRVCLMLAFVVQCQGFASFSSFSFVQLLLGCCDWMFRFWRGLLVRVGVGRLCCGVCSAVCF